MIEQRPSTCTKLPSLSVGPSLGMTLRRHLRPFVEVMAEERRVGDLHQRIIHLEIEDVLDAASAAAGRAGRSSARAVSVPPWPSGLRNSRPGASSNSRPVARSRAGMVPCRKKNTSSSGSPKYPLFGEELPRLGVGGLAGHDQERHGRAVAAAQWPAPSRRGSGTGSCRHRADREHALGMLEAEAAALAAGHDQHRDLAAPQRFLAEPPVSAGCPASLPGRPAPA